MNPVSHSGKGDLLLLYFAVVMLSTTAVFSKLIPLNALVITQHRSVIAALIFLVFFIVQGKKLFLSGWRQYFGVYFLGVLIGLHWITFFHAMQISTAAIGMLSLFSYPVITVLIEPFFKGQKPQIKDLIAAFVVFSGVVVMVGPQLMNLGVSNSESNLLLGAGFGVLSAICFSLRNTLQKYRFQSVSPSALMFHQVIIVGVMCLPFIEFEATFNASELTFVLLFLVALIPTVMGHTFLAMSLKRLPAKTVAIISCAQPLSGMLLAWVFVGEIPGLFVYLGGAIIISVAIYESISQTNKNS